VILDNLRQIRYRMRAAAERAGRNPEDIGLVAVTKFASLVHLRTLLESGEIMEVGENRVQDAQKRKEALGEPAQKVRWRLIGHLQTNKAKQALEVFDVIDSLDSERLAEALDKRLSEQGRTLEVLVQVKLSDREQQSGVRLEEVGEFLKKINGFARLKPRGLMSIAPNLEPVEAVRPHFRGLKKIFDEHFGSVEGAILSMGMSRDFEIAIEEGSNLIRVGSAIFSPDSK
jgi:PLP dependent protein